MLNYLIAVTMSVQLNITGESCHLSFVIGKSLELIYVKYIEKFFPSILLRDSATLREIKCDELYIKTLDYLRQMTNKIFITPVTIMALWIPGLPKIPRINFDILLYC
jgi:hypothetical protein